MQKMYYSTVISFDILLLLISIIIFVKPIVVKSTPVLCNQTKAWKLSGQDIVANSKGFILLVALMPMQCEHCHKQLMKFQAIMETLPEIRIVVVAPYDENSYLIESYRREFPRIAIGIESLNERIWNILSGSAHDHFIYDRCGRLASLIRHPNSDTTKFENTLWALKLAVNYAQCGWCQYDPPDLPVPQKPIVTTNAASMRNGKAKKTRIKAVVYPQNDKRYKVNSDRQSDIASQHERLSLRTNTIAPSKDNARTSGDYILPLSIVISSPVTAENNQKMVISDSELQQKQQISLPKKEPIPQQTQPKSEDGQRRDMSRLANSASKTNDWRISNGLTVSLQFPDQIHQDENHHREQQQQRKKQQRYHQQNERKQKEEHEYALEQLRLQQEHRQRIQQQEEEQRRIQEQQRLQEIQRQYEERHQAQQRFQQQELERRAEEQQWLQKQKTESEFYTDVSDEKHERQVEEEDENDWRLFKTPLHQHHFQDYAATRVLFSSISPAKKTSPLYDVDDEENDYDYSKMDSKTTAAPTQRTQILGTESPEHSTFLFEHQVPCAAFTDKICIEQKRRMGADKMSKCCDKGIYLTDLCVPGYCTNTTIELCCMQKFLQAKYKCCMNSSKEINSPGDAFSRCCFDKFVLDDDKCCPARRAKFHWLSAHEICLPNVRVDLSDLRFSVYTASNSQYPDTSNDNQALNDVITIDLNADKSWDHNCEQGAKVLQFPYLPFDELVDEKEKDESSEKRR
ncbi:Selenoprotein [Dirofilaria immitis]